MSNGGCPTLRRACALCAHLVWDAAEFESALPGVLILSSGQGESRGDQGLCRIHRRMVAPGMTCDRFRSEPPSRSG